MSGNSETPCRNLNSSSTSDLQTNSFKKCENRDMEEMYVDPVLLETLVSFGMNRNLSKKALMHTENKSVDTALQWIAQLSPEEMEALSKESNQWAEFDGDELFYKMVFVVNGEHKMGIGKLASQVAHAALGLYRTLESDREKYWASVQDWEENGEKKVTVRGRTSAELVQLQAHAEEGGLPTYVVQDAGKTQVPEGAITVLAIYGDEDAVDKVTGHLRLLS